MKQSFFHILAALGVSLGLLACTVRPIAEVVMKPTDGVYVPIFLYHHVTQKASYWGRDSISPDELEHDLQTLAEYGFTTVKLSQIVDYAEGKGNLPSKPVALTFDDGFLNYRDTVVPLLEKYGCCATLAVVGEYADTAENRETDNPNFEYMTWEEIASLDARVTEIAYHSYSSHSFSSRNGMKRRRGESEASYAAYLSDEWQKFSRKITAYGISCTATAYPFGSYSDITDGILASLGIKATLTCESGNNFLTRGNAEALYGLKRTNRPHGVSSEAFFKKYLSIP